MRVTRATLRLGLLAANTSLVAALIGVSLLQPKAIDLPPVAPAKGSASAMAQPPGAVMSSSPFDSEIGSRPIFVASRRPIARPPPTTTPAAPAAARPLPQVTILGVIVDHDRQLAFLKLPDSAQGRMVAAGDDIGGWQVVTISASGIVVKSGDTQHEFLLANPGPSPSHPTPAPARPNQPPPTRR